VLRGALRGALGTTRGAAPGSRMWQWGQWSGPVSIDRRQSGHVINGIGHRLVD